MNNTRSLPNLKFLESSKQLYVKEISDQAFISPEFRAEDYLAHSWLWGQFATDRAKDENIYYELSQCEPESSLGAAVEALKLPPSYWN